MIKKVKKFIGDLIERIFRRKELHKIKLKASFLKDDVDKRDDVLKKLAEEIRLLKTGESVNLTWNEKGMILNAIEYVPFREAIELPETKAQVRITWRDLREKIKLLMKEDMVKEDDETKLYVPSEAEPKEDDETKAGENG